MTKKIYFLLAFLLTTLGGGNLAWAADMERSAIPNDISLITSGGPLSSPSSHVTSIFFDTNATWEKKTVESGTTDQDKFPYGVTPSTNEAVSGFPPRKGYIAIVPAVAGTMKIYMISRKNSNKSAIIANSGQQTIATVALNNSESTYLLTSSAEFDVAAGETYYIYSGSTKMMYAGYEFTPADAHTTEIPISALRYRPGVNGISASNGMDRSVGGFNLLFDYDSYNGIKCNNTNNILFRSQYQSTYSSWNHGKMTIALDANNSSKTISQIELCYDSNDFTDLTKISVSSGSLTDDSYNKKLVWTGSAVSSVTFTANYTDNTSVTKTIEINQINVSTSAAPTFTAVTPTITFSDDESTTLTKKGTFTPIVETTPDNFLWEYNFADGSTGVTRTRTGGTAWTDATAAQNDANAAGVLNASGVTATGSATLTANFAGNTFFANVDNAGTYTLSVTEFQQFTPGNPYEWKFNDSTWWETTAENLDLTNNWWVDNDNGIYKIKGNSKITNATLYRSSGNELIETNNLLFSTEDKNRVGFIIGNYIWLNGDGTKITTPSLPAGTKLTVNCNLRTGNGTMTIGSQSFNMSSGVRDNVYTVQADGTVDIEVGGTSTDTRINSIKVEKGTPVLEKVSGSETFNLNNTTGDDAVTHDLVLRVSKGIAVENLIVTVEPSTGLLGSPLKSIDASASDYNTLTVSLTGTNIGSGKVTVSYAGSAGNLGFNAATPVVYNVQVIQQQVAHVWDFAQASYWTPVPNPYSTYGDFLTQSNSKWTNTTGSDYAVTTKVSDIELKAYNTTIPATEGLFVTASAGGIHLNIGNYMSLEGGSAASIRIPSLVAGQHVVFKTEADGGECGVMTTSSNLRLVSGQPGIDGKDAYYTFHVTTDGDGVFTRTSTAANLKIKYIEVIGETADCNEMKFINTSSNADVSNTQVSVASGITTVAPFKLSWTGGGTVTYYITTLSGNLSVTGNTSDGTFTLSGTGTAKIEANLAANGTYQKSYAVMYVSAKTVVTLTLSPSTASYTTMRGTDFGTNSTVTGTASPSRTVYYKSSNEAVARVDNSSGVVTNTGEGTVTITAYTLEDDTYLAAEASYTVTYTPNSSMAFNFYPQSGLLNLSTDTEERFIIPHLAYPTGNDANAFDEITFESSNEDVVTVSKLNGYGTSNNIRAKIIATDDPSKIGQSAIITAIGRSGSVYYYATYTVTITAADECNFAWANPNDIYMYEGDYMEIPAITGNANGNDTGLSKQTGSVCGYYWSLKQNDSKVTNFTYFNKDYRRGEGEPNYTIVEASAANNNKSAYIIVGSSPDSRTGQYPTTLLVYARKEGTVQIHAEDSQTGESCPDITLHIMPKSTIYGTNGELTAEKESVSYPYTWDFTRDFTSDEIAALEANNYYWERSGDSFFNTLALQNSDFCDDNHDGVNQGSSRLYKAMLADHHTMPVFKGMQVKLNGSDYKSKMHKIRVNPTAGEGKSHLYINGGPQYFQLPRPGTDKSEPSSYRVYFKVSPGTYGNTNAEIRIEKNGTTVQTYENKSSVNNFNRNDIYYYDVNSGENVSIGLQDVSVYWFAFSTEAKSITQPGNMPCPAATYCYAKDLDFSLSQEANTADFADNELTAWYASSFNSTTKTVTMSQLTTPVATGQGVFLKAASGKNGNYYMIGKAENSTTPVTATTMNDNLLQPLLTSASVSRFVKDNENNITHTNFFLNYHYKEYDNHNIDGDPVGDYIDPGYWRFYRIHNTVTGNAKTAYLQVPGEQKEIGSNPAASRAQGSLDVSGAMVYIVFEGEPDLSEVTGISSVTDNIIDNEAWYTLQGVRVNAPTKGGIYIHQGKKVVVK